MLEGRSRELAKRLDEWFLRRQALRAARAQVPGRDELAGRAFRQVGLLREVARQVAEPSEAPPKGNRAGVVLSLLRDQVYWTFVANAQGTGAIDADLAALWREAPRDRLLRAAGDESNLGAVERLLVGLSPSNSLDVTDQDVGLAQAFADALYEDLVAPRRHVARIVAQRWTRLAAGAVGVVALALLIRSLAVGPNLADPKHMRVSSPLADCAPDPGCAALLFHTGQQNSPWVQFDLGKPVPIHIIDIANRPDCCQERAVPLVAEIGVDGVHWKEVARQDKEFSHWKAKFPRAVARYVRLRVPKDTFFGFEDVAIR